MVLRREGGWAITGASAVVESPDSTKATQGKAACPRTLHDCVHQYLLKHVVLS